MSLVAGSFALTPNMQAQQGSITASVPFAFSANDQQFEAGEYEIRPLNSFELLVSNVTTHQNRLLPVSGSTAAQGLITRPAGSFASAPHALSNCC